jgi:histidyl-tRNA synthetase
MSSLEVLFAEAVKYTSKSAPKFHITQNELIINSLNAHKSQLEASFKKEESLSILIDVTSTIILQKNLSTSSKLSDRQKTLLHQIDKIIFCISLVPKLNYSQKSDILTILYNGNMKQCIEKIQNYVKITKTDSS